MDTSKTYIKMCVKANEIQKLNKDKDNDFFRYSPYPNSNGHHMPVWLPRQDQLQEMVRLPYEYTCFLAERFLRWLLLNEKTTTSSMEQLWLAFVMKEKFNKTWNSEEWVIRY